MSQALSLSYNALTSVPECLVCMVCASSSLQKKKIVSLSHTASGKQKMLISGAEMGGIKRVECQKGIFGPYTLVIDSQSKSWSEFSCGFCELGGCLACLRLSHSRFGT